MGFLTPISLSTFFPNNRVIDDITVEVIIKEDTSDELTITKQPVQQGAQITDHAYKEPVSLSMAIMFADNIFKPLGQVYQELLTLQSSREPITVFTPKRTYTNMLVKSLGVVTDKSTENSLSVNITFQEVIIVTVSTTQVDRSKQKLAAATGKTQAAGRKQSGLLKTVKAFSGAK